jgi:glycosyltransferase involved in cell wall biosynthesis
MTYAAIPQDVVDDVLLVDDASNDGTVGIAKDLGITTFVHRKNRGYGANQKTCYREALQAGADVVVMLHPDYQYDPGLVPVLAEMVASGVFDVAIASRILGGKALAGGMPLYKYTSNRLLTAIENLFLGSQLSEFHSGYRAFSRQTLEILPLFANSDDFVFDNQILAQAQAFGLTIGEVSCPARYFEEASSIGFYRSCVYGLGVLKTSVLYRMWKWGLVHPKTFSSDPQYRLMADIAITAASSRPETG